LASFIPEEEAGFRPQRVTASPPNGRHVVCPAA
jgi:hypothetical protein